MLENHLTPDIIIDVAVKGTVVPVAFARDGLLIVGIAPRSCRRFVFTKEGLEFTSSFNRTSYDCIVPYEAIRGLRARDTPIYIPMAMGNDVDSQEQSPQTEKSERIDVGAVEFGGGIRKTRAGRFGVVDGTKQT